MRILIANLGSTSLKYKLFSIDESAATALAKGGFERVTDYGAAIDEMLAALKAEGFLERAEDIDAVGFKTVMGKDLSGCVEGDDAMIAALEGFAEVAPAHNPPYAAGIRSFAEKLPKARRVALFETAFYQWVSEAASHYAIPKAWRDLGIRRYGFHGASHKFVAERSAELCLRGDVAECVRGLYVDGPRDTGKAPLRVISCHLGGSSSVTGIRDGVAIGTSMGFTPQSGLPQNNRVGDLDAMALPYAAKALGIGYGEAVRQLNKESGLLGLSDGASNDMRDVHAAIEQGNEAAKLAFGVLIHSLRHWAGSFYLELGGLDALCFTAGIGENDTAVRAAVCENLQPFGIVLDPKRNAAVRGGKEGVISADDSPVKIMVIPANEELVVAREVHRKLTS
ncbi:MAG: acetate/propionate family kinase [Opitutales bacterium]